MSWTTEKEYREISKTITKDSKEGETRQKMERTGENELIRYQAVSFSGFH